MTLTELTTLLRRLTNTDAAEYSAADTLVDLNVAQNEIVVEVLDAILDKNYQGETYLFNLVNYDGLSDGDTGYQGSYAFPSDLLRPVRVELKLDGTNWHRAKIYDINENYKTEIDEDKVQAQFTETSPMVRFWENKMYVRPMPDSAVTEGGQLWYEERHSDLSEESDEPAFEKLFHRRLALKAAINYNIIWSRSTSKLQREDDKLAAKMIKFYQFRLKTGERMQITSAKINYS